VNRRRIAGFVNGAHDREPFIQFDARSHEDVIELVFLKASSTSTAFVAASSTRSERFKRSCALSRTMCVREQDVPGHCVISSAAS
jgi:hypothetical protein